MTVFTDNPAGRLHELLTRFQRNASQQAVYTAWAAVLGIRADDFPELLPAVARVVDLPTKIEAEIDRIDPDEFDRDAVMRWHGHAVSLLGPTLFGNENSGQVVPRITEGWLTSLENCSFVLHRYRQQIVISGGDIQRIRSLIEELRAAVEEELGADRELRDFLLHHAMIMMRALNDYQVVGTAALEDALDQTVGAVQRRGREFESKGYTRREAWKKLGTVLAGVLLVLQIPQTAMELAQ